MQARQCIYTGNPWRKLSGAHAHGRDSLVETWGGEVPTTTDVRSLCGYSAENSRKKCLGRVSEKNVNNNSGNEYWHAMLALGNRKILFWESNESFVGKWNISKGMVSGHQWTNDKKLLIFWPTSREFYFYTLLFRATDYNIVENGFLKYKSNYVNKGVQIYNASP